MLSVALAISAALPGSVALAQEADQEHEGAAAPEPTPPDAAADPRFDPGGESHLPFNLGAPTGGGDDDSGDGPPVDVEPVTDPDALSLTLDDPAAAPDSVEGTDEPVAPIEQPTPAAPSPAPAQPPAATPQVEAPSIPTAERRPNDRGKTNTTRKRARDRAHRRPVVRVTIPAAAVPEPAPAAAPPAPAVAPIATTATPSAADKPARPGQRSYRVRPDDSLWKIASDLLGAGATNAEIAAESNRIYQLNRDQIGSDPDVLAVGTVLRLR